MALPRHAPRRSPGRELAAAGEQIVDAGRVLAETGLVLGSVGNLSVRLGETVLITPTRTPWRRLTAADAVEVELATGTPVGPGLPSMELGLHLAIYRARPDAGAVVHTHSRFATAWSFLGEPLQPTTEESTYYAIGPVRTAAPAPAGSPRLGDLAVAALASSRAVLLAAHGAVAVAESAEAAVEVAQAVEHQASVALLVRCANGGGKAIVTDGT